jgi:hypothetical protein
MQCHQQVRLRPAEKVQEVRKHEIQAEKEEEKGSRGMIARIFPLFFPFIRHFFLFLPAFSGNLFPYFQPTFFFREPRAKALIIRKRLS